MTFLVRPAVLSLAIFLVAASSARGQASLTLVGGYTISGSQAVSINAFGIAGHIQGLAAGYYSFSFVRTPHNFTTQNLQIAGNGWIWSNFGAPYIAYLTNGQNHFSITGIIPYGVECGEYEDLVFKAFNSAGQLVISQPIRILNPTHQAPVTNFKINNSSAQPPAAIGVSNTFASAITLTYTGSGTVTAYRVYATKASSTGVPLPNGPVSDGSWHNGPVPATINVRLLGGGSFVPNQMAVDPGYYLIRLETKGGVCAYVGASPRVALVRTFNGLAVIDPKKR